MALTGTTWVLELKCQGHENPVFVDEKKGYWYTAVKDGPRDLRITFYSKDDKVVHESIRKGCKKHVTLPNHLQHKWLEVWRRVAVDAVIEEVIDEIFGLGPLEPLFRDESITDVMIN